MSYMIVETDNYDGDYPMEKFHLFPMDYDRALRIAEILNELLVVESGYTLGPNE